MKLITAVDKNWAIGKDNGLVFHLKKDLAFFKETTLNQTIIMGSKTFYSLPIKDGACLPGRNKIVLSNNVGLHMKYDDWSDISIVSKIDSEFVIKHRDDFVIGGAYTYEQFMPYIDTMYITHIEAAADEADTYLPTICRPDDSWNKEVILTDEENGIAFSIVKYTREKPQRIVERRKEDGSFERVRMSELMIDDVFRMFEPCEKIAVKSSEGITLFKAISLPIQLTEDNCQIECEAWEDNEDGNSN